MEERPELTAIVDELIQIRRAMDSITSDSTQTMSEQRQARRQDRYVARLALSVSVLALVVSYFR
jgi:alpha-D-ribose 1-methylphosphonate 5-triphosphate synthase subunit PhnG